MLNLKKKENVFFNLFKVSNKHHYLINLFHILVLCLWKLCNCAASTGSMFYVWPSCTQVLDISCCYLLCFMLFSLSIQVEVNSKKNDFLGEYFIEVYYHYIKHHVNHVHAHGFIVVVVTHVSIHHSDICFRFTGLNSIL